MHPPADCVPFRKQQRSLTLIKISRIFGNVLVKIEFERSELFLPEETSMVYSPMVVNMVDSGLLGMFEIENEAPAIETRSIEDDILEELVDELSLGLCMEVHRSCKIGMFKIEEEDEEALKEFKIVDQPGLDVFGEPPLKKHLECVCPSCHRSLSASRFAPHLAKCMGMGRNSSRLASKRLAINTGKIDSDEDDERDIDWTYALQPTRTRRMKKEKQLPPNLRKTSKSSKLSKNGDIPSVSSTNSDGSGNSSSTVKVLGAGTALFDSLSLEDRKRLLLTTCGVVSEHTKKMCTKSLRCPQHSDEQRRAVRRYLLGLEIDDRVRIRPDGTVIDDDVQVDIDTYDDGDSQALRETLSRLRQWENSSSGNPSPTDSTSTTYSNEGQPAKKRKKGSKLSQRKKKRQPPLHLVQSTGRSDGTHYEITH